MKCVGDHLTSACNKSRDQNPTCVNCGELHTVNYHGWEYYIHVKNTEFKKLPPQPTTKYPPSKKPVTPTNSTSTENPLSIKTRYSSVTKNKPQTRH